MSRLDAVNYISHGVAKVPGRSEARRVRGAEDEGAGNAATSSNSNSSSNADKGSKRGQEALAAYCVNLNKKAAQGRIDPLIGREPEVERTIQILDRQRVRRTRFADIARTLRHADPLCDLAIGRGLANGNIAQRSPDLLLEFRCRAYRE